MKVVFFGHDKSSMPFLKEIMVNNDLTAIVLPSNRLPSQTEPLEKFAAQKKIKIFQPLSSNKHDFVAELGNLNPDVAIVCNYSHIIPKKVIDLFPRGMVNFHGGLLPQYRGANVLNWAIINGEKKAGVSVHYINEKIDEGLIIKREVIPISPKCDASVLQHLIVYKCLKLLKQVLREIELNKIKVKPQSYYGEPGYYHRRHPEDGKIDWSQQSQDILNLIRGLVSPWPGAFTYLDKKKIIIDKAIIVNKPQLKPGEIYLHNKNIYFGTRNGALKIKKIR